MAIFLSVACTGRKDSVKYSSKKIYIPNEFADMNFNDTLSRYCYERMDTTSPNIVYFWEKGFGKDFTPSFL